jgi:hypothetical protein
MLIPIAALALSGVVLGQPQQNILKLNPHKKYKLYFVNVQLSGMERQYQTFRREEVELTVFLENTGHFTVDDSLTITMLEAQWTGVLTDIGVGCWYDYFLYLLEDNVIIDEIRINDECKQVITKEGCFDYSGSPLALLNKNKNLTIASIGFNTLETGRSFVNDAKTAAGVYIPNLETAEWYAFDGEMVLKGRKNSQIEELEKKFRKKITSKFPDEAINVNVLGYWPKNSLVQVHCSQAVALTFKDSKIARPWKQFDNFKIALISEADDAIKRLINEYASPQ